MDLSVLYGGVVTRRRSCRTREGPIDQGCSDRECDWGVLWSLPRAVGKRREYWSP